MPTPCTNCLRFHYGECREVIKQCFECQGFNHIERYCPNKKNQIKRIAGEPLAGTRAWCEKHGLQHDPELKQGILNALKSNPGSAIYVNNVCIYLGTEKHFDVQDIASRRRNFEDRTGRDWERSMSPPRCRQLSPRGYRGRSPPRPSGYYDSPRREERYRSRSPFRQRRRTASPYQLPSYVPGPGRQADYQPRSPRYAHDSSAVIFEARNRRVDNGNENWAPQRAKRVNSEMPPVQPKFRRMPDLFGAPRAALQQTPGNVSIDSQNIDRGGPLKARDTKSRTMQVSFKGPQFQSIKESQSQAQAFQTFRAAPSQMRTQSSQTVSPTHVDDPHFVLGITKGAGRDDWKILDAYHQRMTEVEDERRADEFFHDRMPNHVWEESIGILIAAKRQLLGDL